MARVPRVPVQPDDTLSIAEQQGLVIKTIDDEIEFGEPLDPRDPTSVILAGNMAAGEPHNGTRSNILGSWVELEVNTLDFPYDCHHNLYQEQPDGYPSEPVAGEPNCRWFVVGWQHDGSTKTTFDDLRVPTSTFKKGGLSDPDDTIKFKDDGAASNGVGYDMYWFDKDTEEEIFFVCQIPHTYKEGTAIHPHVHWVPEVDGAATETVRWGLEYTWANIGGVFQDTSYAYGSAHTPADGTLLVDKHYLTDMGDISQTGNAADGLVSSMLICRLFRDATHVADDTYGDANHPASADAGLLEFDFHHEVDGPGSDIEYPKTADVELEWCPFNVMYNTADTGDITANSMPLRFYASPFLDVSQGHELKVTLFFIKATR